MTRITSTLVLAALFMAPSPACRPVETPSDGGYTRIGSAGGMVSLGTSATVQVPAGALAADTEIAIARADQSALPQPPAGITLVSAAYALTPHGTAFGAPVTVQIQVSSTIGTFAVLRLDDASDPDWSVGSSPTVTGDRAVFETSTFSIYAIGRTDGDAGVPDAGIDASTAICGDGVVSGGERCDTAITSGPQACETAAECTALSTPCHPAFLSGGAPCYAACVSFNACDGGEPDAGTPDAASDASTAICGDGVVSGGELCDTAIASGPQACPTAAECTALSRACSPAFLSGGAPCQVGCVTFTISALVNGDGCCPAGATPATDSDC